MINIDLIDKKLICQLDLDCRTPISQMSKRLRINRNVANYRIRQLEKNKIIEKYICNLNLGLLGFKTYKVYLRIQIIDQDLEMQFITFLQENRRIINLIKNEGSYDYSFAIAVKSLLELDETLMEIKNRFGQFIKDYIISAVIYSKIFKLNKLLLDEKEKVIKIEKYSGEDNPVNIDSSDRAILKCISQNANLSIMEIASKTRLTVDVVKYRLKNLGRTVINSNRIIIGYDKLGYYHYVFMVRMRKLDKKDENNFMNWCSTRKNILYITKRLGIFDFEINVAIKDIDELTRFTNDMKSSFKDILDSYELVINSRLIKLNYVPFD